MGKEKVKADDTTQTPEQILEDLQKVNAEQAQKIDELLAELSIKTDTHAAEVNVLKAELAKGGDSNAEKVTELEEALSDEKVAHAKTQAEAMQMIKELNAKVDTVKNAAKSGKPTVEVDGKLYTVVYPSIRIGDDVVTAEMLVADADLLKKLLSEGSGMLKAI